MRTAIILCLIFVVLFVLPAICQTEREEREPDFTKGERAEADIAIDDIKKRASERRKEAKDRRGDHFCN